MNSSSRIATLLSSARLAGSVSGALMMLCSLSSFEVQAQVPVDDTPFEAVARRIAAAGLQGAASAATYDSEAASIKAEVAPSDPSVEFEYIWPHTSELVNRWSIGISQDIPDFRKRKAAGKVVEALGAAKSDEQTAIEIEQLYNAEQLLIRYVAAKKEVALRNSIHENFDSLSTSYRKAWDRGEVSILDVNKIHIEHCRAEAAEVKADGDLAAIVAEIFAQSGGKVTEADLQNIDEYPVFGFDRLPALAKLYPAERAQLEVDKIEEKNLERMVLESSVYKSMKSKIEIAQCKVDYASKGRFPQFSVGYTHNYEDLFHFNAISIGATLPVWSRKNEKLAAQGELLALQVDSDQQIRDILAGVLGDYARAQTLRLQLRALAPVVQQTDNMRLLKLALDGGELSLLDYLQEITYFTEATEEFNQAAQDYATTMSSLTRYMR